MVKRCKFGYGGLIVVDIDSGEAKCDDVPLDRVPRAPKRVMPAGVYDIPLGKDFPESMPCFIEVSKGSRNKYEWDNDIGLLRLDRVLHSAGECFWINVRASELKTAVF